MTESESITVDVSAGESLISHVKEGEVALLLHDLSDLAPLGLGRINTGRVVGTGMQQDDAVGGNGLQIFNQTLEIKTNGVLVVVPVFLNLEARVLEDGTVVGPAGGRNVDLLSVRIETL